MQVICRAPFQKNSETFLSNLISGCQVEDIEGNEGIHAANNYLVRHYDNRIPYVRNLNA